MARILLTGGTGFIGRHLRRSLGPRSVLLLGRDMPLLEENEGWARVDLSQPFSPEVLDDGETLCHMAYSMSEHAKNLVYNRNLIEAVNSCPNIEKVVLVSSLSVYSGTLLPVVDEESPCNPVGEYGETKLACERIWREGLREDCALIVLRPGAVVGPGGEGLVTLVRDALYRPAIGSVKRGILYEHSVHYVAVDNVAAVLCFCLYDPRATLHDTYIISDDHYPENRSYAAVQDLVREISGRSPLPRLPAPRLAVKVLGKVIGMNLGLKRIFSSNRIHEAGFEDVVPLREEIRRVVESLEGQVA